MYILLRNFATTTLTYTSNHTRSLTSVVGPEYTAHSSVCGTHNSCECEPCGCVIEYVNGCYVIFFFFDMVLCDRITIFHRT